MESATFETLEATVAIAFLVLVDAIKSTKRNFSTTILVTPTDSPFMAAQFQPWRRLLRTTLHEVPVTLHSSDAEYFMPELLLQH